MSQERRGSTARQDSATTTLLRECVMGPERWRTKSIDARTANDLRDGGRQADLLELSNSRGARLSKCALNLRGRNEPGCCFGFDSANAESYALPRHAALPNPEPF